MQSGIEKNAALTKKIRLSGRLAGKPVLLILFPEPREMNPRPACFRDNPPALHGGEIDLELRLHDMAELTYRFLIPMEGK